MHRVWIVVLAVACGDAQTPIRELSDESQKNLCQHFVDEICLKEAFATFCADICHTSSCVQAVMLRFVDTDCDRDRSGEPITVEDVDACATTGDSVACQGGGGCMFDAISHACAGG